MEKINFKLKIALIVMINLVSVVSFFWILNIKDNQLAKAQTGKYSAVWTPTKCRVAVSGSTKIPVGPAGWKVDYTLADGSKITELWEATSWNDYLYSVKFETQTIGIVGNVCAVKQGYRKGAIYTSGLYSVSSDSDHSTWSATSIPTSWQVAQQ